MKANSLEVDLKRSQENFASKEIALADEHRSHAELMGLSVIEVAGAREKMDKALKDLFEIQKVAQGSLYQW